MGSINHELLSEKFINRGMSYGKLAMRTQISRATLYNVMFGITRPSCLVANRLAVELLLTKEDIVAIFFPAIIFEEELN